MKLIFKGGEELVGFHIDRPTKKLKVVSTKTDYKLVDMEWKMLFDPGKEEEQDKLTEELTDEDFIATLKMAMAKAGYLLQEDVSNR